MLTGRCLYVRESPSCLWNQLCFLLGVGSQNNSLAMMLVGHASVHRHTLPNVSEKSSELISEVSWGREQIEKMTFPQKSFPQWVDLEMSPTHNPYFHLSSQRMRVKTCLGEGWPQNYDWFSLHHCCPKWRRHPGQWQAGRRGCKHLQTSELIKLALIIPVILHPRCCVANRCIAQITVLEPFLGECSSPQCLKMGSLFHRKSERLKQTMGRISKLQGLLISTGASLTQPVQDQGAERTLKVTFLLSGFDCCVLLACRSRPLLFCLPFPEVHLAINGRFEFRHSLWGKHRLQ